MCASVCVRVCPCVCVCVRTGVLECISLSLFLSLSPLSLSLYPPPHSICMCSHACVCACVCVCLSVCLSECLCVCSGKKAGLSGHNIIVHVPSSSSRFSSALHSDDPAMHVVPFLSFVLSESLCSKTKQSTAVTCHTNNELTWQNRDVSTAP